jgi:DNA mismatch repair protein MutL
LIHFFEKNLAEARVYGHQVVRAEDFFSVTKKTLFRHTLCEMETTETVAEGKIRVMPDVLASQVAAGEVVERPASVIKELVENSLDAGARAIEVRIERGGLGLMRVSDDGVGMNRADAVACLGRHATSKLRTADDLATLLTLGFRGEALPSIASVARLSIGTREGGALAGTEVIVEGGHTVDVRDWGGAPGTVMEVRQLFYNVPARRKFLRTEATEFGHIEQGVRVQAIAHPEVAFTLIRDGQVLFQLPGRASLIERLRALIGSEAASSLIECPLAEEEGMRLSGWFSRPGSGRSDRSQTLFFINGRAVENVALTQGLRAAYGETLMRGQHPLVFLFLEIDPAEVDVNVHPAKREVRFHRGHRVQDFITRVLTRVMARGLASPVVPEAPAFVIAVEKEVPRVTPAWAAQPQLPLPVPAPAFPPKLAPVPPSAPAEPVLDRGENFLSPPAAVADVSVVRSAPSAPVPQKNTARYQLLGRLGRDYALFQSEEGLVTMELRAAQERVVYEEFLRHQQADTLAVQPLLVPVTFTVPPLEAATLKDHADALRGLGFSVEEFGHYTFKLDAVPAVLAEQDPLTLLQQLAHELAEAGVDSARRRLSFEVLAQRAAHCVRALPLEVSAAEIQSLLDRLLACDMPYCDPSGRPTLIQTSFQELARKFGRR